MRQIGFAAMGLALFLSSTPAGAQPTWSAISFSTTPGNVPMVQAATDTLLNSAAGKEFPGKLLLLAEEANGSNPATHSFIPLYKTAAEREAFVQKLEADPAWNVFLEKMTKLTQPVSTVRYRTLKSWGDIAETDRVWMGYGFKVDDARAFTAAIDKFLASPTGKKFPGQVYLSVVVAGGLTPVTHVVSVGYASEAEMEAWTKTRDASSDWATFMKESRKAAEYLGGSLARELKSWGPATFSDLTGH